MSVHMPATHQDNLGARLFAGPMHILREHRRAYVTLNIFYYGVIVLGMIYAVFDPGAQQMVLQSIGTVFTQGPLAALGDAYLNAKVVEATGLTFVVNLFIGSFATITLPSLILPFSGLFMGAYRAFLWGLIYSPTSTQMQMVLLPHSLTLILEGQAYVLTLLGVVIQGRALLLPRTVGATTHLEGLWTGIKLSAQLYILVILVLAIAAIYEVLEAVILFSTLGS
jgi:hypothetical protein